MPASVNRTVRGSQSPGTAWKVVVVLGGEIELASVFYDLGMELGDALFV